MKAISFLLFISSLYYSFQLFKKYGYEVSYTGYATFDASDFDEGEEMHFKAEAYDYDIINRNIPYYYKDSQSSSIVGISHSASVTSTSYYTEDYVDYVAKYFTIKKQKSEFSPATQGKYIVLTLPVNPGDYCLIENTKEDEGKLPTWAIVVIIVVVVLIIAGIIIYCCYRRKRNRQLMAQTNAANVAAVTTAVNIANQQNIQAQVYQAQAYQAQAQAYQAQAQAYQAQAHVNQQLQAQAQAYQAQTNAAPTYPQQNYQAPINSNDVGYSSKAVM